jgi:hypothetical protein
VVAIALKRETKTEKTTQIAACQNCAWADSAKGALGRAAQHHDRTQHEVHIETTMRVIYGNREDALRLAGQTSFEDEGQQQEIDGKEV